MRRFVWVERDCLPRSVVLEGLHLNYRLNPCSTVAKCRLTQATIDYGARLTCQRSRGTASCTASQQVRDLSVFGIWRQISV